MARGFPGLAHLVRGLSLLLVVAFGRAASSGPAVDVPARQLRDGARVLIGLNPTTDAHGALSADGALLALAGGEGGVQLIDVVSGRGVAWRKDLACREPDPRYVGPCAGLVAFSTDGAHLWVWLPLRARLLRLAVPSAATEFEVPLDNIYGLVPLPEGRIVGLRQRDSVVVDATGKQQRFFAHQHSAVAVSPDGKQIVLSENDRHRAYEVETGAPIATAPEAGLSERVGFLPDGRGWIGAKTNRNGYADVVTWSAGDKTLRTLARSAEVGAYAGGDVVQSWVFPPPYTEVWVTMRQAGLVRVSLDGNRKSFGKRGVGTTVVTRPDGHVLHNDTCVERVDRAGLLVPGIQLCGVRPSMLAFDGPELVAQPWGTGDIERFDARSGAFLSTTSTTLPIAGSRTTLRVLARDERVRAKVLVALALPGVEPGPFSLSEDGRWLFRGSRGQASGASIVDLDTMQARTNLASFFAAGDGSIVLEEPRSGEGTFEVRRVVDHALLRTLKLDLEPLYAQLSGDGRRLVVQSMNKTEVVDVTTGRKIFEPACRSSYTGTFEFSRDGAWLVCDTLKETVVYDIVTRKVLRRVAHPDSEAADAFALSDDKHHLAVAAYGLRVFDL